MELEIQTCDSLKPATNPLTADRSDPVADLENLAAPSVLRRPRRKSSMTQYRDLRRKQTAKQAIESFTSEVEIFGFTKGQFSLIDLITATLDIVGRADLTISTWTASHTDVTTILEFVQSNRVDTARWLVDLTFQRRTPALAKQIREVFGADAIRVAKTHAKFATISNDKWQVVIRTSMNLNFNPRFEDFTIAHDPRLFAFLSQIVDEVWSKQKRSMADERPYDIIKHFEADL